MSRRVFYSFHYKADCFRVAQIRNMGVIEGNRPATDNEWQKVESGGDKAVQRWIDGQLSGKSCVVVLIGENTASRKWIDYEIMTSWNSFKGLFGIYIHGLKNNDGRQSRKGRNPFDSFMMLNDANKKLASLVKVYDPPYAASTDMSTLASKPTSPSGSKTLSRHVRIGADSAA